MKRTVLFILAAVSLLAARPAGSKDIVPANSERYYSDTLYIDSTETEYSDIFWQVGGGEKVLLVDAADTNAAGFASDSATVSIELMQVFGDPANMSKVFMLRSRAQPDSTLWAYSDSFFISASLAIATFDTLAYWSRTATTLSDLGAAAVSGYTYGAALSAAVTTGRHACIYRPLVPDASPGICFKIKGAAGNAKRGAGSRWILSIYQVSGQPVTVKAN
jgi:hypothetical protein